MSTWVLVLVVGLLLLSARVSISTMTFSIACIPPTNRVAHVSGQSRMRLLPGACLHPVCVCRSSMSFSWEREREREREMPCKHHILSIAYLEGACRHRDPHDPPMWKSESVGQQMPCVCECECECVCVCRLQMNFFMLAFYQLFLKHLRLFTQTNANFSGNFPLR